MGFPHGSGATAVTKQFPQVPGRPLAAVRRPDWLRWAVAAALAAIAIALLWVTLAQNAATGLQIAIVALAASGGLWLALQTARAKGEAVILTDEGLFDDAGERLCALSDIVRVDSGLLSFRPSKGFLVRLKAPAERGWSPGLWWRLGTRLAVGGATPGRDGKSMADLLTNMIAERDGKFRGE